MIIDVGLGTFSLTRRPFPGLPGPPGAVAALVRLSGGLRGDTRSAGKPTESRSGPSLRLRTRRTRHGHWQHRKCRHSQADGRGPSARGWAHWQAASASLRLGGGSARAFIL